MKGSMPTIGRLVATIACGGLCLQPPIAQAQKAVVSVGEVQVIARGYSARNEIIGATIYDERGNAIGKVDDILISKRDLAYGVIDVGPYVGEAKKTIPLPVNRFIRKDGRLVLVGATREELKKAPPI